MNLRVLLLAGLLCCSLTLRYSSFAAERNLILAAGELQLGLTNNGSGFGLVSLRDVTNARDLLPGSSPPLFTISLKNIGSNHEVVLRADSGWGETAASSRSRRIELTWAASTNSGMQGISVKAIAAAEKAVSAIRWNLRVMNSNTNWTLWRVLFPDVALVEPGSNAAVFFPRGPGEVQREVWTRPFDYKGNYPDGWCSMQFVASYSEEDGGSGLYVAAHDPFGSTKTLSVKTEVQSRTVRISFDHPVPNMSLGANAFSPEGDIVWQLFRGNWFDAAMLYKTWARKEAKWWPRLGRDGRTDTPRWMKELSCWTMTGGASDDCVDKVEEFRAYLGLALGFHWYNWHQIPFDNDYPHYFPSKKGFAEGVSQLKAAGVFPMPYINGRLWDSKDRGGEDFEFTRQAIPGVTKKQDGSPELESYGSKETNGQPVRLGVMCPSTSVWRNTVSNIVLRLLHECGTSGVYIDQIAAAAPKLCMDRSHGHPLGGGHWWTESYWRMLQEIRNAMPDGTMLTTECNAEPFIRWFDGYLTWHWQHNGQVPAFPAVYGGTVQMFGRAYRGGATKDLALRMKAGQQLVFGEQLGWLDPAVVKEKQNAEFLRRLSLVRSKCSRYFYAGQMARPPKLTGNIPRVQADWQWSGEWVVTTDAVLAGAWRLPKEHRVLLLFVNVGDETVTAKVCDDRRIWEIPKAGAKRELILSRGPLSESDSRADDLNSALLNDAETRSPVLGFDESVTFRPREVQAWTFSW